MAILVLSGISMTTIIESMKIIEQKHPFWAFWERYFVIPISGICFICFLCLLPYFGKLLYEVVRKKIEPEIQDGQENVIR